MTAKHEHEPEHEPKHGHGHGHGHAHKAEGHEEKKEEAPPPPPPPPRAPEQQLEDFRNKFAETLVGDLQAGEREVLRHVLAHAEAGSSAIQKLVGAVNVDRLVAETPLVQRDADRNLRINPIYVAALTRILFPQQSDIVAAKS